MNNEEIKNRALRLKALFNKETSLAALQRAFVMLRPDIQWKNPVLFVVEVGAFLILLYIVKGLWMGGQKEIPMSYFVTLDVWLFLTLLFANFATAIAEVRGKALASDLKKTRRDMMANRLTGAGALESVSSALLQAGDRVLVRSSETIPGDGEIIEGAAYIDESAITGESAPDLREANSDRSGVTAGTVVLTDQIVIQITGIKGNSFLDRIIAMIEGAVRQRTPNELDLSMFLSALTLIFLIVTIPLWFMAINVELYIMQFHGASAVLQSLGTDVATLIALLVCLIPTTIGALLSAIGIAGVNRAFRANVLAFSGEAVERSGDIDVILLDKTGTVTTGNRRATQFHPLGRYTKGELIRLSALASHSDFTPEGKSIKQVAEEELKSPIVSPPGAEFVAFSAKIRMSGIDLPGGKKIRKGAPNAICAFVKEQGGSLPKELEGVIDTIASAGSTPIVIADGKEIAGVIELEDVLKQDLRERLARLKQMGLKIIMITGDNPRTAATLAAHAGIDEFLAEVTPEQKLDVIVKLQAEGKLVAMMGDGTNDAPALAQADIGVAMNAGTQAAKEAANMVDMDSDPAKLITIIEIGKQLLITRGALTTFSITNDVAKYFAIIPALFSSNLPWLNRLNIMHLHSPTSAILSAVIFNALIIVALIPIALKGVRYRALGADALLRSNLLVWGLGGVIIPFLGIKLIDMILVGVKWIP